MILHQYGLSFESVAFNGVCISFTACAYIKFDVKSLVMHEF